MKVTCVLLTGFLFFSSAAMSRGTENSSAQPAEGVATPSAIDALFRELVSEAQQVHSLLCEVSDKESADRVAPALREKLHRMAERLHTLESYPFDQDQDAEALKSHMASLTHVSQFNLATMQRLAEVNAYGSESLMEIFNRYKIERETKDRLDADDLPQTLLYSELTDALEEALYALRRVQSEEQAQQSLAPLRALLIKIESAHSRLALLAPPYTDEQKEALRPARERLLHLSLELKEEITRIQAAKCFLCGELDALLPRLLRPAAS